MIHHPLISFQVFLPTVQPSLPHCQLAASPGQAAVRAFRAVPGSVHHLQSGYLLGPPLTLLLHLGQTLSGLF